MKWLVMLVSAALLAQQPQEQDKPAMERKKASIEGTVVEAASGKPLRDVSLSLTRMGADGGRYGATTDAAGHYIMTGLEAGTYALVAQHPRYGFQPYGAPGRSQRGAPLTISAGQELKQIDLKLQRRAVISGKVVDEDGEPLKGVMVAAVTLGYQRGRRQYWPAGTARTNDLGEFRVTNLTDGKFLVVAILTPQGGGKPSKDGTESTYLSTYYPNSPDADSAAPVTVASGAEVGGIDIRLIKAKAVRVSGKVVGMAAGQRLMIALTQKNGGMVSMMSGRRTMIKATDGSFEIPTVAPGSYLLRVGDPAYFRNAGPSVSLEVGDKPVTGLTVDYSPPPDLNGEVVFNGDQSQRPPLKGLTIMLEAAEEPVGANARTNDDGTFQVEGVGSGRYFVRVMPTPDGTYVSSVALGNARMSEDGLEIGTAGGAKLEIKLSAGAAQVGGTVQDHEGKPMGGVRVALIPKSRSYLLFQSAQTDQNGSFSFKNLTPEDYVVLAVEDMESAIWHDPEFLKRYESKGEKVTLKENDRKGVTLKLIPKE